MSFGRILTSTLISLCSAACVWSQDTAQLGNVAFEEGRYTDAVTHYKQALSNKPSFAVQINLGHAYMKLEQWADAAASYRAAIELDAASVTPEIWLFLGQAHYQSNQYNKALDAFRKATPSKPDRQANLWIARCLIELEQWLQAKLALLAHLGAYPKDVEALELLAHVSGQMDDWPGAVDTYRALLATAPDRTAYRIALANVLTILGQNREAIDALEIAWRTDSGATGKINRLLADLYLAEEMPHEAALCYARIIHHEEHPSADDYFRLGIAYFQGKEFVSAKDALHEMQRIAPSDFRADLYLGHIATEASQLEQARQHFQATLAKAPTAVEAILALAQLEMQQQHYEQAATHFAEAIRIGDERPQVHYNHVLALLRVPEATEQVETALKTALARHPSDVKLKQLLDRYVDPRTAKQSDR